MMIDMDAVWAAHMAGIAADRGDEHVLHGSDLHACDYATFQRLKGEPRLPFADYSLGAFFRGHALEGQIAKAVRDYAEANGLIFTHGRDVEHRGIVGHVDFDLATPDGTIVAVIDPTTTAAKTPEWKYGHALKSAFYASILGAPNFCEWVFCYGFGGLITAQRAYWFETAEWSERVTAATLRVQELLTLDEAPEPEPPVDPTTLETEAWRCGKPGSGKSYCEAMCKRNARL